MKADPLSPTLEELSFEVDENDPDRYVFVQTRRKGDDDFNDLGEDPEEVDEYLQSYLNDMGRNAFTSFHRRLAKTEVTHCNLDEASDKMMGLEWTTRRHEQQMQSNTPHFRNAPRFGQRL